MVRLAGSISRLSSCKIMVAGDLMLDTYTIGKARRISPEAPVAVVNVEREENRAGGAGNVILNLVSMGAKVVAVGRLGRDAVGEQLRMALLKEEVDLSGVFFQTGFSTPMKNRIIAENQQIVRVDYEQQIPLPELLEQEIIEALPQLLQDVAAIAISDYGKGFLSRTLLSALIEQACISGIPVITDPKGSDFKKYSGTTVIKPNLSEAYAAAGLPMEADLDLAAQKILQNADAQTLMVTRSEAGISIFPRGGQRIDFPVKVREVKDVTGAGDTVLAVLTYAIANGLAIEEAAQLSNVAAGIAIERFGCARITLSELARRLLETDAENKIFDEEHLFVLQEALRERRYILLGLSGAEGMSSQIFSSIHHLAKRGHGDLVIYLWDQSPNEEFISLLASLKDVSFIILQGERLSTLCETIKPAEIYAVGKKEPVLLQSISELLKLAVES